MQEINDSELKKYKNIERFVYDDISRNAGVFSQAGMVGIIFNGVFGTIFLIFDILSIENKIIPISLIILNILMGLGFYLILKKDSSNETSYKYNYFIPNLFIGLSGVYSSLVFLYTTNEALYWTFGSGAFAQNYMRVVIVVFILIIIIQFIWYSVALKKGYFSNTITYHSSTFQDRMDLIAKILLAPAALVFVGISPFAYILTRIFVHTAESYPLKLIVFVTLLLVIPFGLSLSFPVFIWWYMVRKYRKYIPQTLPSLDFSDYHK